MSANNHHIAQTMAHCITHAHDIVDCLTPADRVRQVCAEFDSPKPSVLGTYLWGIYDRCRPKSKLPSNDQLRELVMQQFPDYKLRPKP